MPDSRYRIDHQIIADLIKPSSSVLDLGCGEGNLLELLVKEKDVCGFGIEKNKEMLFKCFKKALPVTHANVDKGLDDYLDKSFDYVVLSLTLQALKNPDKVLKEMLRVGKKVIVSFPNFGNISIRMNLFFKGKMPKSKFIPFEWYDTPNIHFCSIKDFRNLCKNFSIKIDQKIYLKKQNRRSFSLLPNLLASIAIFVLES